MNTITCVHILLLTRSISLDFLVYSIIVNSITYYSFWRRHTLALSINSFALILVNIRGLQLFGKSRHGICSSQSLIALLLLIVVRTIEGP